MKGNIVRAVVGICAAALMINRQPAFAADPGGHFGFVKATFTGSACDTTSDVFANAKSWVLGPEEMYADSLPEKTTVAYGSYMYMEAGVQYDFKGCYDDYVTAKIGSTWVLSKGSDCQERTGSFTPTATDWYKIDLRVANNGGVGGCRTSSQYGILWKKSPETTWRKFAAGDLFKTGETSLDVEKLSKPIAEIISAQMRETDPTVMDVTYRVHSTAGDTVNVRALAFQDGERSFANVVRPAKFLEGGQIGDGVPANAVNSFAWQVSADWDIDLAKVAVEVLAQDVDAGLVPLDLVTIPAHGDYGDVTVSTNIVTDAEFLDALYWLYANGDKDLTLKNGWLLDSQERILVKGNALQGSGRVGEFIYGKMGCDTMGTDLENASCRWPHAVVAAVERVRRVSMPYSGNHRYTIKGLTAPPAQTMGSGLYMVVDLSGGNDYHYPVTYMDSAPAKWSDDYKTNKIVLRRVDGTNGAYYVGVFEITEAQWDKVMGGLSTSTRPKAAVSYIDIRGDEGSYNWLTSNEVARNSFMGILRLMTGLTTLDLPTEAEWEFAARAGVTTTWLCGDSEMELDDYAWYKANSDGSTHEVGTRQPNAWGLYDVHGNLWEWCLNRYSSGDSYRALRGGAYKYDASSCAFAYRYSCDPSKSFDSYGGFGFRLACRPESN